jgi:hypothetical protein
MDIELSQQNLLISTLFVIALSISGWALVQEVDLQARVKVLEAVSVQERADNDRRFGELSTSIKQISDKLDRIGEKLGTK